MEREQPSQSPRARRFLREWVLPLLLLVAAVVLLRAFVVDWMPVQGDSMLDTLHGGECMLVTRYDYLFSDPERFDVVICRYPDRGRTHFVKRVVGVPGDTVAIEDGTLYLNGQAVDEPYITHKPFYALPETVLGDGEYFVLGDNRSNSNDSHVVGPIAREDILAHVRLVFWPLDSLRTIE